MCKEPRNNDPEIPIKTESKAIKKKYKVLPFMKNMNQTLQKEHNRLENNLKMFQSRKKHLV